MQEFISTIIGGLKILFFKQENRRRGEDCGDIRDRGGVVLDQSN